jgi:hypothetical protein
MASTFLTKNKGKKYFEVWMNQDCASWCSGVLCALGVLAFSEFSGLSVLLAL